MEEAQRYRVCDDDIFYGITAVAPATPGLLVGHGLLDR